MAVKLVVMYPHPKEIDMFEYVYKNEHVPMAVENLSGKTKIVATRILSSPFGTPPFHRVAEVYFPSLKVLEECAASDGGKLTIAHALSISSGGIPTIFVAEEETFVFEENQDSAARSACVKEQGNNRDGRKFDISEVPNDVTHVSAPEKSAAGRLGDARDRE